MVSAHARIAYADIYVILRNSLNFTWPDQNKRPVSLPAPTYIDYVMSWVQRLIDDEGVFPTKSGKFRCWCSADSTRLGG